MYLMVKVNVKICAKCNQNVYFLDILGISADLNWTQFCKVI